MLHLLKSFPNAEFSCELSEQQAHSFIFFSVGFSDFFAEKNKLHGIYMGKIGLSLTIINQSKLIKLTLLYA